MSELVVSNGIEFNVNGKVLVSSLQVAARFGKQHKNVMRDIGVLIEKGALNFEPTTYVDVQNRSQPMYLMDRDGFSYLAMGFTGDEAFKWKQDFMNAFNKMEEHIRSQQQPKELTRLEILQLALESEQRAIAAESKVAILTHVNKTYTATEIAKEMDFKSATAMNKKLHEMKVQYKQGSTWVLYSKYADQGYVDIKQEVLDSGRVIYHRKWTQIGREFLLELLSK